MKKPRTEGPDRLEGLQPPATEGNVDFAKGRKEGQNGNVPPKRPPTGGKKRNQTCGALLTTKIKLEGYVPSPEKKKKSGWNDVGVGRARETIGKTNLFI